MKQTPILSDQLDTTTLRSSEARVETSRCWYIRGFFFGVTMAGSAFIERELPALLEEQEGKPLDPRKKVKGFEEFDAKKPLS